MSKELTEQWRNGTLPRGAYYVNRLNEIRVYLVTYEDDKNTHEIFEVLAPVPSYDIFCALRKMVKNINRREMQLTIAIKALKEYECCENGSYASKALALIKEEQ